jgi:hypothetical protein
MSVRPSVVRGLLVAPLALLTAGASGEESKGRTLYKTPQAVFEASQRALKKNDWKAFASCLTEKSRDQLAGQMALGAFFLKQRAADDPKGRIKDAVKKLDEVFTKHGLTKARLAELAKDKVTEPKSPAEVGKAMQKLIAPIKDRETFIGDVMAVMEQMHGKKGGPPETELKDVKVDGDTATGTAITRRGGKEMREPFAFKKSGGSWRIELRAPSAGRPQPKSPPRKSP